MNSYMQWVQANFRIIIQLQYLDCF